MELGDGTEIETVADARTFILNGQRHNKGAVR
jgi:hypothetical protein